MKPNPNEYAIVIREEIHEGETYVVGRALEFPNICVFASDVESAREQVIDLIETIQDMCIEDGENMPLPMSLQQENFSGRVTLRMPASLHARTARQAEQENVSLNQYIVTALAHYAGMQTLSHSSDDDSTCKPQHKTQKLKKHDAA